MRTIFILALSLLPQLAAAIPFEDPDPVPRAAFDLGAEHVNGGTGNFTTEIPFRVPAYRNLTPSVGLHYSSSGANDLAGAGWSIAGFSTIERVVPGHGSPQFTLYGPDHDVFTLDGQDLIPCALGSGAASCLAGGTHFTQTENYLKIVREPALGALDPSWTTNPCPQTSRWLVTAKDGTQSIYRPTACIGGDTMRWGIRERADTHGNTIYFYWMAVGAQADVLPRAVLYGTVSGPEYQPFFNGFFWVNQNVGGYPDSGIQFVYETRPDPILRAGGGFLQLETNYRLKYASVAVGTQGVVTYQLDYTESPLSGRSALSAVTEMEGPSRAALGNGTILAPVTNLPRITGYESLPPIRVASSPDNSLSQFTLNDPSSWGAAPSFAAASSQWVGDFNGDGKGDLLFADQGYAFEVMLACPRDSADPICLAPAPSTNQPGQAFLPARSWGASGDVSDWRGVFVQDFDGDGKDDLLTINALGFAMHRSTGDGFAPSELWAATPPISDWASVRVADFNGDGRPDLHYIDAIGHQIMLNTGTSFEAPVSWGDPPLGLQSYKAMWIADFNGDGRADLMFAPNPLTNYVVRLSQGDHFEDGYNWAPFDAVPHLSAIRVADFNGDGKADVLYLSSAFDNYRVMLSGGNGFGAPAVWAPYDPTDQLSFHLWTPDLNADGRADLLTVTNNEYRAYLSHGDGFQPGMTWAPYEVTTFLQHVWIHDFDGDGRPDLMYAGLLSPGLSVRTSKVPASVELVHHLENGLGGSMDITYAPALSWPDNGRIPPTQTVTSIRTDDGRGLQSLTRISYAGGRYDYQERHPLGFRFSRFVRPCLPGEGGGNGLFGLGLPTCPYIDTYYRQDYGNALKPERVDSYGPGGILLSRAEMDYQSNGSTLPHTSLEIGRTLTSFDGAAKTTRIERSFDAYGNPIVENDFGEALVLGDEVQTVTDYAPNLAAYIVGLPARVLQAGGAVSKETRLVYDGASSYLTPPTQGALTRRERWLDTTMSWVSDQREYDSYGNTTAKIDPNGIRTEFDYDSEFHQRLVRETNALGQVSTASWDRRCGIPRSLTDFSGFTSTRDTDGFCRVNLVSRDDGNFVRTQVLDLGTVNQRVRVETPGFGSNGPLWTEKYFDGIGRQVEVHQRGPSAGRDIVMRKEYGPRGKLARESAPYYLGDPVYWTGHDYDALDRETTTTAGDGSVQRMIHGAWSTSHLDELGHTVVENRDARGHVISATQDGVTTSLGYDGLGRLVQITDAAGNTIRYGLDSLDRRVEDDDPDLGLRRRTFDAGSRLTASVDALGQRTELVFDAIGRVLRRTSRAGQVGARTDSYAYDEDVANHPGNLGRMTSVSDPSGVRRFTYDPAGNLTEERRTIDGLEYVFARSYDAAGRLTHESSPVFDAIGRDYTYDEAGRALTLSGFVDGATYAADGALETLSLSNGVNAQYLHDPARRWVVGIRATRGTMVLQDLNLRRDAEGKIIDVASPFAHEGWHYDYDGQHRLLSAVSLTDSADTQTFTYDSIGNILSNSRVGCYTYPAPGNPRPHGALQAGGIALVYDGNGGAISRGGIGIDYDGDERVVRVGDERYAYDASGERIRRETPQSLSVYPAARAEITDGIPTLYFSFGGLAVGKKVNGVSYWLHPDAHGSVQAVSDASGRQVQRIAYRPYGERLSTRTAHEETVDYVGEHRDATGLMYLHARYYDPLLGRFLSADTLNPMEKGVGLDRYGYGADDPINHADPSGAAWYDVSDETVNRVAGFGDGLSGGATKWIREKFGIGSVDVDTNDYALSNVAGTAAGLLGPGIAAKLSQKAAMAASQARIAAASARAKQALAQAQATRSAQAWEAVSTTSGRLGESLRDVNRLDPVLGRVEQSPNCSYVAEEVANMLNGGAKGVAPAVKEGRTFSELRTAWGEGSELGWAETVAELERAGPGSHGIMGFSRFGQKGEPGHVLNLVNKDGVVMIVDAQVGRQGVAREFLQRAAAEDVGRQLADYYTVFWRMR